LLGKPLEEIVELRLHLSPEGLCMAVPEVQDEPLGRLIELGETTARSWTGG